MQINLSLWKKQSEAFLSEATEILYGGAAGGGKSHLMRVLAIYCCLRIPDFQVYLFRRKRKDLIKNHVEGPKGFRKLLAPLIQKGEVQIVADEIRFHRTGARVYLSHCKDEKDKYNYQGAEIHLLLIDELTHFTETIYKYLRGRLRKPGINVPADFPIQLPRILCSANPGNIGHHWVKAAFVDFQPPMHITRMPDSEGGMLRQFIPALLDDNPSMLVDDPEYEKRLEGLGSPELVKALRWGDWTVIAGAYFTEFNMLRHVYKPFQIPPHWMKFRAYDWGFSAPFSCGWYAVSDGSLPGVKRNCLVKYREWYGCKKPGEGLGLQDPQVAQGIVKRTGQDEILYSVADPAIFRADTPIAETFANNGVVFRKADNERIAGWQQVRYRLDNDLLIFFNTCTHTIRTLPAMQYDEHKLEDLNSDMEDHAVDETRYACMSRPITLDGPREARPVKVLKDYTINELFELEQDNIEERL